MEMMEANDFARNAIYKLTSGIAGMTRPFSTIC